MRSPLIPQLTALLDSICRRTKLAASREAWTAEITNSLIRMGERNGFTVAAPGQGGWLYDVTWLNYSGDFDARLLREIPLAVESEWNPDVTNLRVDFNKLLFSRANLCLFVCNDRPSVGGNARPLSFASQIELLLESVRAARNKDGFKMLVGCYMNAENRFQYVYLEGDEKVQILTNGRWMPWRWGRAVSG